MKLDEARIVLRPRSTVEILELGLRFCSDPAARIYAKLAALTLAPAWVLCLAARWAWEWEWVSVWVLALVLATPLQGLFTVAIGKLMFAETVGVGEIVRAYVKRLPAYLGALLVSRAALAVTGLLFFLVVPPLWMWGRCAYVHEASLLEQAGPVDALRRSARIVTRNVTGAVGLLVAMSAVAAGFVIVAEALLNAGLLEFVLQVGRPFGSLFGSSSGGAGGSAAALLGLFMAVPYWASVRFLAYVDLRTRRDGWDVQVRFMAILAALDPSEQPDIGGAA